MTGQLHVLVLLLKLVIYLALILEKPHIVRTTIEKILHNCGEWKINYTFK